MVGLGRIHDGNYANATHRHLTSLASRSPQQWAQHPSMGVHDREFGIQGSCEEAAVVPASDSTGTFSWGRRKEEVVQGGTSMRTSDQQFHDKTFTCILNSDYVLVGLRRGGAAARAGRPGSPWSDRLDCPVFPFSCRFTPPEALDAPVLHPNVRFSPGSSRTGVTTRLAASLATAKVPKPL
jgi:hypothetical protein